MNGKQTKAPGRNLREAQTAGVEEPVKSSHNVSQMETKNLDSETEAIAHTVTWPPPKPWNPPWGLKFPCPLGNHKHEENVCSEFFNLTPLDRWEKIEKSKMCYSCLKPKTICRGRSAILLVVSVRFWNILSVLCGRSQRVWLHSTYFSVNRNFKENQELRCQKELEK